MFSWSEFSRKTHIDCGHYEEVGLLLDEVLIRKASRELVVRFGGASLNDAQYGSLFKMFEGLFPKWKLHIHCPRKEELDPYTTFKEWLFSDFPSARGWLKDDSVTMEENCLSVVVPSEELKVSITERSVSQGLSEKFGVRVEVHVEEQTPEDSVLNFIQRCEEETIEFSTQLARQAGPSQKKKRPKTNGDWQYGRDYSATPVEISHLESSPERQSIIGEVFYMEAIKTKNDKVILRLAITDHHASTIGKIFFSKNEVYEDFADHVQKGSWVSVVGRVNYDPYEKGEVFKIEGAHLVEPTLLQDEAEEKRIELHAHSNMSPFDGLASVSELVAQAKAFGHDAIAITDHGGAQGFPEAMAAAKKEGIHVIYGMEGTIVEDLGGISLSPRGDYVVFDLETTGLSPYTDRITEIGAVKIQGGRIVDSFSQLVNPERPIPLKVQELTHITDAMVAHEPTISEVLPRFFAFCEGHTLVAHNAAFDTSFLRTASQELGLDYAYDSVDTLQMAQQLYPQFKRYNLGSLCKKFGISLLNAHRAVDDSRACGELFLQMLKDTADTYKESEGNLLLPFERPQMNRGHEETILVANLSGLKSFYQLISDSHLKYHNYEPRIPRSVLEKHRKGLLIGSGGARGAFYRAVALHVSEEKLLEIGKRYDYFEIEPPALLLTSDEEYGVMGLAALQEIVRKICALGKALQKPVVAVGNVRYLRQEDELPYRIVRFAEIPKNSKAEEKREAMVHKHFSHHFRTTQQMLEEFSFLGDALAREVVIEAPRELVKGIVAFDPIPEGKFPPKIEGAEENLRSMSYGRAHEIYGNPLPPIVEQRLEKELRSIIDNGYAVMYIIAHQLVKKSNEDGYYVGSRGSVGSSLVATMSGITEVNPLVAHYVCPHCHYSEFDESSTGSGVDLEDKNCPKCGTVLRKDGHNIPFEVFLGFYGDKEPDIDLNFAGEYQSTAHKYIEELFGEGYVFRAGTITTLKDKTVHAFIHDYFETEGREVPKVEVNRLAERCVGVRRSSGQHPGGIMICPKEKDIHDFTPIQYPAEDGSKGVITTHFDYHSISENILKLDILGHDTPTIIRALEDFTGFSSDEIPLDNKETLSLFESAEVLDLDPDIFTCPIGTLGIPEFGTNFVIGMLLETKPKNFSDLVRISGLSHGTDVWTGNAQELVKEGRATLPEVISTREDIMVYLINAGAENKMAFDVMESVRKGKGIPEKYREAMEELSLPPWYLESCEKIQYMFPKAHAVAYVTMSFRIAYYKVFYPEAFYASYFSQKLSSLDGDLVIRGPLAIKAKIAELEEMVKTSGGDLEKKQITTLTVALEMMARGITFSPIDLYRSDADRFLPEKGSILLPFQALSGLGDSVAMAIVEERKSGEFLSIEDFKKRTKVKQKSVEQLINHGVFSEMPETNQLSLF